MLRSVIGTGGQRVHAGDRLYLAEGMPVLIIWGRRVWGRRDPLIPVHHGEQAHEAIPGSRLEIFDDVCHLPQLEAPERFIAVLERFIAEDRARSVRRRAVARADARRREQGVVRRYRSRKVELMPEAKPKRRPAAKKQVVAPKPRATNAPPAVERTTELSEDVLKELEDGARSALEAVRKFLGTVDEALPPHGEGPSRREEVTDSALEMAQRLVHTQAEFLRKVVDSAGKSLSR